MIDSTEKKIKIGIFGSAQTGKKTFLQNLEIDCNRLSKDLLLMSTKNISLLENEIRASIWIDPRNDSRKTELSSKLSDVYLNGINIYLFFFDISNEQSFKQVRSKWFPLVQGKNKNNDSQMFLIANKIDLQPFCPLQNFQEYAKNNNMPLYFCGRMSSINDIFNNILMKYLNELEWNKLIQSRNNQVKSGFFSRIFLDRQQTNQSKLLKQRIETIRSDYLQRVFMIRNKYLIKTQEHQRDIYKAINKIFQNSINMSIYTEDQYIAKPEDFYLLLKRKISQLDAQLSNFRENTIQLNFTIEDYKQQIKKKQQQLKVLTESLNTIKTNEQQHIQRIFALQSHHEQLQTQRTQTKSKIQIYEKENEMLRKQNQTISRKYKCNFDRTLQLQRENQRHEQQFEQIKSSILGGEEPAKHASVLEMIIEKVEADSQAKITNLFAESRTMKKLEPPLLNDIQYVFNEHLSKEVEDVQKLYAHDSRNPVNVLSYIEGVASILFIIKLQQKVLLLYSHDQYCKGSIGKQGILILIHNNQVRVYKANPKSRFWKYDYRSLIFGNNEIVIFIGNNSCSLTLRNKKQIFIELDQNNTISSLLGIQNGQRCNISHLQIMRVHYSKDNKSQ